MTHINAYMQEVENKRAVLSAAQAEFDAAVEALYAKEVECGLKEPEVATEEPVETEQPKSKGKKVEYR